MYRHIVIGYDGTDRARDAAALAVALAQATGASLTFVDAFYDVPDVLPDPLRAQLYHRAEHDLRDVTSGIPSEIPTDKHLVAHRSPARALFEFAEESDADLIVLGSSRQAAAGQVRSGRLARQVLNGAPCAVAIAPAGLHEREDPRPRRIGVGVNGDDESGQALAVAGELTQALQARLLIMAAVEPLAPGLFPYSEAVDRQARESLAAAARRALDRSLESAPEDVPGGPAARALVEEADAAELDLLVVGSRGFGPIRRVLLGSVSHELMREAPCSLIVVPRGARNPALADARARETVESR